jgi:gliding motility-associated-like protein
MLILIVGVNNTFSQAPTADFSVNIVSGCAPIVVSFTDLSTNNPTAWNWDLGNGSLSMLKNPSTTYVNPGVYTIRLTASNTNGSNSITKTGLITVHALPTANFGTADTVGCLPLTSYFADSSSANSGSITKWEWNFGDGGTSLLQNPSHLYSNAGMYGIFLKVTNSFGCSATKIRPQYIKVGSNITASFTPTVPVFCAVPVSVGFTNNSTGLGNLSYQWRFGDGGTSTLPNPQHSYNANGNYTVTLVVRNDGGCIDSVTVPVAIQGRSAAFNIPTAACVGTQIVGTATSTPAPNSITWLMGDGTSYTGTTVNHTYTFSGTYTVKMINDFGSCIDSIQQNIVISQAAVPAFSSPKIAFCSFPATVTFTDNSVGAVSWEWNFGDGNMSTLQNPTHTYTAAGAYNVSLSVTNAGGCRSTIFKSNYITIRPTEINLFNFPARGCAPFNFTPAFSINPSEPIASYLWDFGDGFTSTSPTPNHTYTAIGSYTFKVKITTISGCVDTITMINAVQVGRGVNLDFTASPTSVCAKTKVYFTPILQDSVTNYHWDFGDGGSSALGSPNHMYTMAGNFTVSLIVLYNGCSTQVSKPAFIQVNPPVAKFTSSSTCEQRNRFEFTNTTLGATGFRWFFGDGDSSTAINPIHTYATAGNFAVKLIATNGTCSDTLFQTAQAIVGASDFTTQRDTICRSERIVFYPTLSNPSAITNFYWDFGNGDTFSATAPIIGWDYFQTGNYSPTLITTDYNGCKDTVYKPNRIRVNGPKVRFSGTNLSGCTPVHAQFLDTTATDGTNAVINWQWNFGDGTIVNYPTGDTRRTHSYLMSGLFDVKLKITDQSGCSDSAIQIAYINTERGIGDFSSIDSMTCQGKVVRFTNNTQGSPINDWKWYFGDGATSTLANPTHLYVDTGVYNITLIATASSGCRDSITKVGYITIKNPKASIIASDTISTCPPMQVNFTDGSYYAKEWYWTFGDGNYSVLQNPTSAYLISGNYDVRLIVTSPGGCKDTATQRITVSGPYGSLTYQPLTGCLPLTTSYQVVTRGATEYIWDFADGSSLVSTDSVVTHTYVNRGDFKPVVLLKDATGCVVPISGIDTIHVEAATALFNTNDRLHCDSGMVQFNNISTDNGRMPATYQWTFGNGNTSSVFNPTQTYLNTGNYYVSLKVTTNLGCTDSLAIPALVKVVQSPRPVIVSDSGVCVFNNYQLTAHTGADTSAIVAWQWQLGNGQTSQQNTPPVFAFQTDGQFMNSLQVTNSSGCVGTVSKPVLVHPLPTVLTQSDTTICRGNIISLAATGAATYSWSTGSGSLSCVHCPVVLANPQSDTKYFVKGTSIYGCENFDTVQVKVMQPYAFSVSKDEQMCVGDSRQLKVSGNAPAFVWSPAATLSTATGIRTIAKPTVTTTYSVIGYDSLGCFNDTQYVKVKVWDYPTVNLSNSIVALAGSNVSFNPIVSSDVVSYNWAPATGLSCTTCPTPELTAYGNKTYQLKVANGGGCVSTDTIQVLVNCEGASAFVPNTFSPNGDGANDVFYPRGKGLFRIQSFRVFSRWGNVVFDKKELIANNPNAGWDGRINGQIAEAGVYTYTLEMVCTNGQVIKYFGNITLIQ